MATSVSRNWVWATALLVGLMLTSERRALARTGDARPPKAVVKTDGLVAPGRKVTLDGSGSVGDGLRYRWVQTRGTTVKIDDPSNSIAHFEAPADPSSLGFLLVVSNPDGSDMGELSMAPLLADAGDDQSGLVNQPVTLRARKDETAKPIGFRWLQVAGPTVRLKIEEANVLSFVPVEPGVYRFALVVALDSKISEPDEVVVTVGNPPPPTPAPSIVLTTQDLARQALTSVRGGTEAADPLARLFEDIAERMDLYESYPFVFSELSRRLEKILPTDPVERQRWNDRLFGTLSARIVSGLLAEGLDLRTPEGNQTPLSPSQKSALAAQFRAISEGFRSASRPK